MFLNFFKKRIIDEPIEKQKEDLRKESPGLYLLQTQIIILNKNL